MEAADLEEDIPSSHEFLHQLPEQKCKAEEKALIITTLDSISEAQADMSMATINLSSLVKITDPETFKTSSQSNGVPHGATKHPTLIPGPSTGP